MTDLFVAFLVNEIAVDGPGHVPYFEESVVLLTAQDEQEAERLALAHGRAAEHSYRNEDGEMVRWSFRTLVTVSHAVDDDLSAAKLATGVEVGSRFFGDLDAYLAAEGLPDQARWTPGPDRG